ncbi:MAG: T9SS type A sorting domain-containing protein [Bacteroidetes bacterium]|nr:T9SS type A sorting domain-containing protein [Bacteroidota bacterium]
MIKEITKHLSKLTLAVLILLSSTAVFAGTQYVANPGITFVDNLTQWNAAFAAAGPSALPAYDEYYIGSGSAIIVGKITGTTNNVDLTGGIDKRIIIQSGGALGFRSQGFNALHLSPASVVEVEPNGQLGFYLLIPANFGGQGNSAGSDWYGNTNEFLFFTPTFPGTPGATPAIKGPYVIAPTGFGTVLDVSDAGIPALSAPKTRIWNGSAFDYDWNNANNWAPVQTAGGPVFSVPSGTDVAIIPDSNQLGVPTISYPELQTQNITVHDLVVEDEAYVGIDFASSLNVTGDVVNIGTISLQAGGALKVADATDWVANIGGDSIGFLYVNLNLAGPSPWFMSSMYVTGAPSAWGSSCGDAQIVPTACDAPSLGSTTFCTMELNQSNTATALNCSHSLWNYKSSGLFTPGRGFSLYAPSFSPTWRGADPHTDPVSYGPLGYSNLGNLNLPAGFGGTVTRGWHMLGNPYSCPIELTAADRAAMGFEGQMHFWDNGSWVSPAPGATVTVAVGQGFQMRVAGGVGGSATFAVNEAHRKTTTGVTFYKTEENDAYVNITIGDGAFTNKASVYFVDGATDAFDGAYDANRLFGLVERPYVYTIEQNGEFLSYNALPLLVSGTTKSVPLSVHIGVNGTHTLTFDGIDAANATVVLEDLTSGNMYPVTEGYVHSFSAQTSDNPNRFVLHFSANAVSGIKNMNNSNVTLFPNPTTGRATIMLNENHGFNKVTVLDFSGRVVYSEALAASDMSKTFEVSGMSSGIYTVRLTGTTTATQKLIKQ